MENNHPKLEFNLMEITMLLNGLEISKEPQIKFQKDNEETLRKKGKTTLISYRYIEQLYVDVTNKIKNYEYEVKQFNNKDNG